FENPEDVLRAVEGGVDIEEVNVGSLAHSVGKVVVSNVLSMGPKDVEAFDKLKEKGIKFDVRKVPNDNRGNMNEIMKKAKNELARA
ncbi:PTS sugar transporter subunit IIB, partial [Carnobacterium sp.]|uniref:PTS sugar transporter subunit IIB n=1 Tax=Carnobacterium sp. TaxID=48221 RepID=UPI0028A6EF4A